VVLGVFSRNEIGLQGAVMQMVCHGLSTGALFIIAGLLQERLHSREFHRMGGLWSVAPRLSGLGLLFGLASLGLPGMGNFVAEFLVLLGTYMAAPLMAVPAALGLVLAAVYSLSLVRLAFFGPRTDERPVADLSLREGSLLAALAAGIIALGLFPQPVIDAARPSVEKVVSAYHADGLGARAAQRGDRNNP
jgi:NADH-quinone oxidoreductase subunit M